MFAMKRQKYLVGVFAIIIIALSICGEARWCTHTKTEQVRQEVTRMDKCNQTYEDNCSFFSWDTCTFYELVDCPVRKNITVTRYFMVEECCRGLILDPINNVTCIPDPAEYDPLRTSVDDDNSLLFDLSHGAYAGIVCTLLFVICVLVLIMLHIRKRTKRARAKANKTVDKLEMETTQKMLQAQA